MISKTAFGCVMALGIVGCGEHSERAKPLNPLLNISPAATASSPAQDPDSELPAPIPEASADSTESSPTNSFEQAHVVRSQAAECTTLNVSARRIIPDGATNAFFDTLGRVGERRFAYSSEAQQLVTFDETGDLSTQLTQVAGVTSDGSVLNVLFQDSSQLLLQKYDERLAPLHDSVQIAAQTPASVSIAAQPSQTAIFWLSGDQINARIVGVRADSDISLPAGEKGKSCRSRAVAVESGFALGWACPSDTTNFNWALLSEQGTVIHSQVALTAATRLELVDLKPAPQGYVALLHDPTAATAYIVLLDALGKQVEQIRAFTGIPEAFGLIARGPQIGLTAKLESGLTAFVRIRNMATAAERAEWLCLDAASPGSRAALDNDEEGYAIIVRYGNGSEWFLKLAE